MMMVDMDEKKNQLKRRRNEARRDMENVMDDLLQAQANIMSFEEQREEEHEEMQHDALQARAFYGKMVENQALQIRTLQKELEETREATVLLEVSFIKTLGTKTTLIEEQASSMRFMRKRKICQYDKLDSVREEHLALGALNCQLLRVEAEKREAIRHWDILLGITRLGLKIKGRKL